MNKFLSILFLLVIVTVGFSQKDLFIELIRYGGSIAIPISILFVAILVFFPIMPFVFVAGIIGAVFGIWTGSMISLSGALLGTSVMFYISRYGFRNWTQRIMKKYPKAAEYELFFKKNAFLGILLVRIIPLIPQPGVNILCGVSRVPFRTFFLASLIGKIPSILIFTFAGSNFEKSKLISFFIYSAYFVIISVLAGIQVKKRQLHIGRN